MSIALRMQRCWRNTADMPLLLRVLCQGCMTVCPLLLALLVLPVDWMIDGTPINHLDLWLSAEGIAIMLTLSLAATGSWGLAGRIGASRWLLVATPAAGWIVFASLPTAMRLTVEPLSQQADYGSFVVSAIVFILLFRTRAVQGFLDPPPPRSARG